MNEVKYSICITHYNNAPTVRAALESLLDQIDNTFEIVIVDNFSSDGSLNILQEYSANGKIRLVQKRCSRGLGRTAALEHAIGRYIISGLDMDDTFRPRLLQLLDFYKTKCDGMLLRTEVATLVATRELLLDLGGWHDLQFDENWELSKRAAKTGKFRWTIFPLLEIINKHKERRTLTGRIRYRYVTIRENYRVGHRPFGIGEKVGISKRLLQVIVLITLPFYTSYRDNFRGFTVVDPKFFVDSSDWWKDLKGSEELKGKYNRLLGKELE